MKKVVNSVLVSANVCVLTNIRSVVRGKLSVRTLTTAAGGDVDLVYLNMAHQVDYTAFIEIDPEVRFGRPVIKGTRITVYDVLGWLAAGMSHQEILEDFPQLKNEQILACLSYAKNN